MLHALICLTVLLADPAKGGDGQPAPKPAGEQPAAAAAAPAVEIQTDASAAPEFEEWLAEEKRIAAEWYPKIVKMLESQGHKPATVVRLVMKKGLGVRVPAYATGNTIYFSAEWFKLHPDDRGVVVHELVHVLQAYPSGSPGWVVEGIADYIRWCVYEPEKFRPYIDPAKAKWTDSYQTTGAFLAWVEKSHAGLVGKMNEACRNRKYSDAMFKEITGEDLPALWAKFIASRTEQKAVRLGRSGRVEK